MKIYSLKTSALNKKNIYEICKLKDTYWKFGIKSQMIFFKKNIKKNDIHNLIYIDNNLIGYTLLRLRKCIISYNQKKLNQKYLLFDTLILKNEYRKRNLSHLLMNLNSTVILRMKLFSFLICNNKLLLFYKKFGWKKLNNKNIKIMDKKFVSNGMIFNENLVKQIKMIQIKNTVFKFYYNK